MDPAPVPFEPGRLKRPREEEAEASEAPDPKRHAEQLDPALSAEASPRELAEPVEAEADGDGDGEASGSAPSAATAPVQLLADVSSAALDPELAPSHSLEDSGGSDLEYLQLVKSQLGETSLSLVGETEDQAVGASSRPLTVFAADEVQEAEDPEVQAEQAVQEEPKGRDEALASSTRPVRPSSSRAWRDRDKAWDSAEDSSGEGENEPSPSWQGEGGTWRENEAAEAAEAEDADAADSKFEWSRWDWQDWQGWHWQDWQEQEQEQEWQEQEREDLEDFRDEPRPENASPSDFDSESSEIEGVPKGLQSMSRELREMGRAVGLSNLCNLHLVDLAEWPSFFADMEDDVEQECGRFGEVLHVGADTSAKHGTVWVHFAVESDAKMCKKTMNGRIFAGRRVRARLWP